MRQAIEVKYVGPTNTRGSRYIATSASGHRLVHQQVGSLNPQQNAQMAAAKLACDLDWSGMWEGGSTKDGWCFVNADGECFAVTPKQQ